MPMRNHILAGQERLYVMAAGEGVDTQDLNLRGPWV